MKDERLVEGEDYTMEGGLFVFTRKYLLRRGTCCKSGCRNCPYGFRKEASRCDECEEESRRMAAEEPGGEGTGAGRGE